MFSKNCFCGESMMSIGGLPLTSQGNAYAIGLAL
jgi:adenylyl- and sulfurtransferase ThiI